MTFKKVTLDIVTDVIQSPVLTGPYRGKEVNNILDKHIKEIDPTSLLIIDLRKANPLEYIFCKFAFGPFLKTLQENNTDCKLSLFYMHEYHKSCFFRGVLKHIDKDLPRSESMEAFVESGMFTMIRVDEEDEIHYVSVLSSIERQILNYINEKKSITGRQIIEKMQKFQSASIIDALRSLDKKGFIIQFENSDDNYHSIYNYLTD